MSWNAITIAEQLVTLFEGISTSSTLEGVVYNTTVSHVYREDKPLDQVVGQYNLALVQEVAVEYSPKDTNWTVFKTFIDFTLYGYVKSQTGKDATTDLSYLKRDLGKLIQDCSRVLLYNAIANVNASPAWILSAKDEYDKPVLVKFYDAYDMMGKNSAVFACPFKIQILWHDRLLGEVAVNGIKTEAGEQLVTELNELLEQE